MNKILIIIAFFLTFSIGQAGDLPSVKDRVQEQYLVPQEDGESQLSDKDLMSCENNLEKYKEKVNKYLEKNSLTSYQKWKLNFYRDRLAYWLRYCEKQ